MPDADPVTAGLLAGVARVNITPPLGAPMLGYAGRGLSQAVHDDLTATALVLEGPGSKPVGRTRVAILAVDLCFLGAREIQAIRRAIGELAGVQPDRVLINSSHNHYGPVTDPSGEALTATVGPQVGPYVENLVHMLAGATAMACSRLRPARLRWASGRSGIGVNRRERLADGRVVLGQNPEGPYDPRVAVLRIDGVGDEPLAALMNFSCHPTSLGGTCRHVSADFVGTARALMEDSTGAMCLFLQGAAGNINPRLHSPDWSHLQRLGVPLGAEAARVWWEAEPLPDLSGPIVVGTADLALPPLLPASVAEGCVAVEELEAEHARLLTGGSPGQVQWAALRLRQARSALAALCGDQPAPVVEAEIMAIAIGSVGIITAPGEVFTEIGQSILARSPFPHTIYSGYTNGYIMYVPTRSAYAEGGYEVARACQVGPDAGEILEEESVKLLNTAIDPGTSGSETISV